MNLADNEIIKALEHCFSNESLEDCGDCPLTKMCDKDPFYTDKISLDLINRLKKENDDLFYKLEGVMLSVDKWLEGDELKLDEVNRAVTMREKTLQIIEQQKAEIDKLNIAFDVCKKEYDDMFEIAKNQKAEIERLRAMVEREREKYEITMDKLKETLEERADHTLGA